MDNSSNNNPVTASVCTYNILADRYAIPKTFPYCDRKHLTWKSHRRHLVLSQLSKLHCDIIFLQEVDKYNDIENYLRGQKYFTIYHQRPQRKCDGCLIAFKLTKFELDSSVYICNYNELCPQTSNNETDRMRYCKDNIGMIVVLKSIVNPKLRVIVCNTHLYWNPNMEDVKLFQTGSFLNSIEWVIHKHQLTNYRIIIGGDFNSQPKSTVYQLIMDGHRKIPQCNQNMARTKPKEIATEERKSDDVEQDEISESKTRDNDQENDDNESNKLLRIICDRDLRKAAQWLSLMEIDAAYFGDNSTENYSKLFEIARNENRIIVTRNKRITSRSDCPKFLLIGSRETQQEAYQHVINYFGITIDFKKKQYRDNIEDCLACPKCLKQIEQKSLDEIKDKLSLISDPRNENLMNGKSCKGVELEFYECVECGHLVYHRVGWLDRLHERRQKHYNSSKNLHKQFFQGDNNGKKRSDSNESKDGNDQEKKVKENETKFVWGIERNGGVFKAFGRKINVVLNELNIGMIYKSHFSNKDDTMYEIKKISNMKCEARNTKTNDTIKVLYKEVNVSNSNDNNISYGAKAKILKDHVYRKRRPVIIGVEVLNGNLKKYDRIIAVKDDSNTTKNNKLDLGIISEIQDNGTEIEKAKQGSKVCIKLDTEHMYGRQFDHTYHLMVQSRKNNNDNSISMPTQIIPINDKFQTYPSLKSKKLKHKLKLKSVYYSVYGMEPMTTNHTKGFSGCLDYLFVSIDTKIKQCDKLPVSKEKDKEKNKDNDSDEFLYNYLPDKSHPSDHIPIKAILQL